MTSDDDRIAYLAGDVGVSLDADDQADLDGLRDLLADPSVWTVPDLSLEDRIVAAVTAEAARGAGADPTSHGQTARQAARSDRRRPSRRRLVNAGVGAAAAAVVIVGVTIGVLTGGADARRYTAALAASGPLPAASGGATFTGTTSGWKVELRASGLPRRDNGRYYEAWMTNRAHVMVPIGTFNQGPEVTLWSGVSPKDFPTIAVTEEVTGNPSHSGPPVLVGTVTPPKSP